MTDQTTDISFEALRELRDRLDQIDEDIVKAMATRQNLVSQIGELKAGQGHQTRDYKRERIVIDRARDTASREGVDQDLAASVLEELIRSSLQKQEKDRVEARGAGSGKRALVIGGAGRMGGWFVDFFDSQGYIVSIADPAADQSAANAYPDLAAAGTNFDIIVVATTLALSAQVMDALAKAPPDGLIFDVGSLKTPLRQSLERLAAAGARVTSIHPMFGPSTRLLAGRQVIFIDVGNKAATEAARQLFESTMATCIDMSIDEHDLLISYVLGLSHAANIVFVDALSSSGIPVEKLLAISSPTFDALIGMGRTVVNENPDLYYEIQRLNDFGGESVDALAEAMQRLRSAVEGGDQQAFVAAMQRGRAFFESKKELPST